MTDESKRQCTRCKGFFLHRESVVAESEDPAWCRTCRLTTARFFAEWMFDEPTTKRDSSPGSATKVMILEKRYAEGIDLWNPLDFAEASVFTPENSSNNTIQLFGSIKHMKFEGWEA